MGTPIFEPDKGPKSEENAPSFPLYQKAGYGLSRLHFLSGDPELPFNTINVGSDHPQWQVLS